MTSYLLYNLPLHTTDDNITSIIKNLQSAGIKKHEDVKLTQKYIDSITEKNTDIAYTDRFAVKSIEKLCVCGAKMFKNRDNTIYICSKCYMEEDLFDDGVDATKISILSKNCYNTSSESALLVNISGPGCYAFKKQLYGETTEYNRIRYKTTLSQMTITTENYTANKIPNNIVKDAADMYYEIQVSGVIKRGDVRKGAMAACLLRICDNYGISKKRSVICDMFNIRPSDLSNGEKIIDRLCAESKINRPTVFKIDTRVDGFLTEYFLLLNIPIHGKIGIESTPCDVDYFNFTKILIKFTVKFKIACSSNPSSKSAGAIYILSNKCASLNITVADIERVCDISFSTFKRYYDAVNELLLSRDKRRKRLRRKLRHLFNKYKISLM